MSNDKLGMGGGLRGKVLCTFLGSCFHLIMPYNFVTFSMIKRNFKNIRYPCFYLFIFFTRKEGGYHPGWRIIGLSNYRTH